MFFNNTTTNSITHLNVFQQLEAKEGMENPNPNSMHSYYGIPRDPFWYVVDNQNGSVQSEKGFLEMRSIATATADACEAKAARINRKLARQKSKNMNHHSSSSSSSSIKNMNHFNDQVPVNSGDLYDFITPDNKKLRVILKKELKNSDVGSLGRIVLPKREAEENLPCLSDKDGIQVLIRDVYSSQLWSFKYKFWSNNKSRMYVLENTGEFVKQNGLEMGDSFTIFEDESKNLYFSIRKVKMEPLIWNNGYQHYNADMYPLATKEEEEASLALLIEQLKHREQQEEANSLLSLSIANTSSLGYVRATYDYCDPRLDQWR